MEIFDLVDEENRVIGSAARNECHGNPAFLHRAVHVMIEDSKGRIFLQKRSLEKDIQPGKWDTSVGGHLDQGESYLKAAVREAAEELGVELKEPEFLYQYIMRSDRESQFIQTFGMIHDGPFALQKSEISEGRFWETTEIEENLESGIFTPNFEDEFSRYKQWNKRKLQNAR